MSYEKNTWNKGDVITANKLNHMEDGIADGGILVVNAIADELAETITLDKTWQQIYDAAFFVIVAGGFGDPPDQRLNAGSGRGYDGQIGYYVDASDMTYITDSPDGYPVSDGGK